MKRILGLDLGVSSIGWALVNEAENENEKSNIIKLGVRVNPLTVDEQTNFERGKSITTNADRTLKRGMRRSLQRYKMRRAELIRKLQEAGIINDSSILYEEGNRSTFETYRLRAKAATEEITLEEFARVLIMINKKRGYKSNRKAKGEDEGNLVDGMEVAKRLYDEGLTPGQYSLSLIEQGKKYLPEYYQSDLQSELSRIWEKQRVFYPDILTDDFWKTLQGKSKTSSNKIFMARYQIYSPQQKRDEARRQLLQWRVEGLSKQLPIEVVSAVVSELNGQINGTSGYLGKISDRSKELYFTKQTVGQYMMAVLDKNPNASLRNMVFYRQDYLDEFNKIWGTQAKFHPELSQQLKHDIGNITIFYQRPLRSQKGLIATCELEQKQVDTIVDGKSKTITIGPKVCPKSSPLFQEFRIWQRLNDLRIVSDDLFGNRNLDLEEKQLLAYELSTHAKLTKTQALKILFGKAPKNIDLNFKELDGNTTQATLFKAYQDIIEMSGHGEYDFSKMTAEEAYDIVESVFSALGYNTEPLHFDATLEGKALEKQPYYQLWHLLYSYEGDKSKTGDEALIKKIREIFNFDNNDYAKVISQITFQPDYGSLSAKAIRNLLPHMYQGLQYSDACEACGYRHSARSLTKEELESKELKDHLDLLPRNSLRNPVVEKILNQMINVVNSVVETYGPLDEVRIELARDLKQSAQEREDATNDINKAKKDNEEYRKILQQPPFNIQHPSRNDLIRYKLYLELKDNGFHTLYSNTYIQKENLFTNDFDIEHIIPQATAFDDSFSNKTLELRSVNLKKGDKTAYDFIKDEYGDETASDFKTRVDDLLKRKSISSKKHENLLKTAADVTGGFINRDLRDTQYISRKAREILEGLVRVATPTTGKITDKLRNDWGLVNIMKELNWDKYEAAGQVDPIRHEIKDWTKRNDHRHHAMDALTIAFTRHSIVQYYNNMNARADKTSDIYGIEQKDMERHNGHLRFKVPVEGMREEAKRQLQQILVSIKSKTKVATQNVNRSKSKKAEGGENRKVQLTPRTQLHKETIYGCHQHYEVTYEKVGSTFDEAKISTVANKTIREALAQRLAIYGHPKKAFTGKNSLEKNPIWLNADHSRAVPLKVKCVVLTNIFTIRKPIDPNLTLDKVVDPRIKSILKKRIEESGGDVKKAFSNLDENPIWLDEERGIAIKRVTINAGLSEPVAIHEKRDRKGNLILDKAGKPIASDFVQTSNNHHVAIFEDAEGKLQEHIVSYYEAMARLSQGLPVVDHNYNAELGWKFRFTMKQNEYFMFPSYDFNPSEIDLMNPDNNALISGHLFRVQKMTSKDYFFRHHMETTVEDRKALHTKTWIRITNLEKLRNIVKVRVNHIGQIVAVGEY